MNPKRPKTIFRSFVPSKHCITLAIIMPCGLHSWGSSGNLLPLSEPQFTQQGKKNMITDCSRLIKMKKKIKVLSTFGSMHSYKRHFTSKETES